MNGDPYAAPDEPWRADGEHGRAADLVPAAIQILKRHKQSHTLRHRTRRLRIHRKEPLERQRVLIVIKLPAHEPPLCSQNPLPTRISNLKIKLMPWHLRHQQTFQSSIRRKTQHRAVRQQILTRNFPASRNLRDRRQLHPARSNRAQVLPLARDERRCRRQRQIRNRIIDLAPEKVPTHKESLTKLLQPHASLTARQPLRSQRWLRVRDDIANAKISIQLIQRRPPERSIRRTS